MSTATLARGRAVAPAEARHDYYTVAPESDRENAVEALLSALLEQDAPTAVAGFGLVREVVTHRKPVDYLSAEDAAAMLSIGEARIPEYTADDSDLLVDDDD